MHGFQGLDKQPLLLLYLALQRDPEEDYVFSCTSGIGPRTCGGFLH